MLISGVDFNPEILNALDEGNLVVFAGAGVSMGPSCGLDDFVTLAEKIGEGTDLEIDEEYPEVFLGKLKSNGVKINKRLHQNLLKPDSSCTPLHQNLVRLFTNPDSCRIITTNYDLFFEEAYEEVYGEKPRTYISPALPLGNNFKGIVHVHGALNADEDGIVLADDDFGRAYLTQGWARRFLREVFEMNTILFVGYSHDDTVMKYLARGLPPSNNNKRFVLTGEYDEKDHWKHLGIEAIEYPQNDEDDYESLNNSVKRLADLNEKGALDLEKRISEIVSSPSELDKEKESQLQWYLSKEFTTRFFCEHAEDIEWLNWANKNGYLKFLYKKDDLDEREKHLAKWFSEFAIKNYQRTLEVFTSQHQKPNSQVVRSICSELIFAEKEDISKQIYSSWFPVLLPFLFDWHDHVHPNLFQNIGSLEANEVLLLLFNELTKPQPDIGPYFPMGFEEEEDRLIEYDIKFNVEHYVLDEAFKNQIKPKIDEFAYNLLDSSIENLSKTYFLNKSWGKSSDNYDRLSRNRSAIEPHDQDKYPEVVDVLIDAARDAMNYLVENESNYALSKIKTLLKSDSNLIRRIAIHGLCGLETLSPKEKVSFIQEYSLLSEIELKHEVYRLLSIEFPKISKEDKKNFIDKINTDIREIFEHYEEDDKDKAIAYQKFNLLKWIQEHDKDSEIIKSRLNEITDEYQDFKPREYLDLLSWTSSSSTVPGIKPIEKEQLLSIPPADAVDYILEELPDSEYDKGSELYGLTNACQENNEWGKEFSQAILDRDLDDVYIINAVLKAWNSQGLKKLLKDEYFDFISSKKIQKTATRRLARNLQSLSEKEDLKLTQKELDRFEQLIDSLWKFSDGIDIGLENSSWLERAINHPAGKLVMAWIKVISLDYKLDDKGTEISQLIINERFKKVIDDATEIGSFGKAILGSQFDYFLGLYPDWTKEELLPLFNFNENESAEILWDGWLSWGRLNLENLEILFPHYINAVEHLAQNDHKKSMRFASHVADLTLFVVDDPIHEILNEYISKASENSRVDLINQISNRLKELAPDKKEYHWEKWIKEFIQRRIHSIPKGLSPGEYEGILNWIINLEPVFEDAVQLFTDSEPLAFKHSSVFTFLLESDSLNTNPDETIKLVLHIIEADLEKHFCYQLKKIHQKLEGINKSEELYEELSNRLAEMGCI